MVASKKDVLEILKDNCARIRALGVNRLGLFGSFVRNQQSKDSDVDVLVEFDANQKTFDNFMDLAFFLEEKLERRVEIVTTEALSQHIGPHILAEVEYVPFPA